MHVCLRMRGVCFCGSVWARHLSRQPSFKRFEMKYNVQVSIQGIRVYSTHTTLPGGSTEMPLQTACIYPQCVCTRLAFYATRKSQCGKNQNFPDSIICQNVKNSLPNLILIWNSSNFYFPSFDMTSAGHSARRRQDSPGTEEDGYKT